MITREELECDSISSGSSDGSRRELETARPDLDGDVRSVGSGEERRGNKEGEKGGSVHGWMVESVVGSTKLVSTF